MVRTKTRDGNESTSRVGSVFFWCLSEGNGVGLPVRDGSKGRPPVNVLKVLPVGSYREKRSVVVKGQTETRNVSCTFGKSVAFG